jgi:hypothetical protein
MISIRRKTGKMRANRVGKTRASDFLLSVFLLALLPTFASAAINHESTVTAADGDPTKVSSLPVSGVGAGPNRLYVAAIAIYGDSSGTSVSSLSGGGLTWTLQKSQCSARLNRARMEVWQAFGSPSANFDLDITLTDIAVVTAAVSRYSGVDSTTPTEGAAGSNTYGMNGICDGNGTDNDALSLSLTSSNNDSVLYATSHPRNRSLDVEDAAYTQRAWIINSDSSDGANLFVHDRSLVTAGTDSADHTASSATSWEMAGLVINPASVSATAAVTSAVGEISPNDVDLSSTGNSFSYDIQATISGSATTSTAARSALPTTPPVMTSVSTSQPRLRLAAGSRCSSTPMLPPPRISSASASSPPSTIRAPEMPRNTSMKVTVTAMPATATPGL